MNGEVSRVRKRGAKGEGKKFVESSDEEIDPYGDRRANRVKNDQVKRAKSNYVESEEEDVFHLKSHPVKNETEPENPSKEDQAERFAKHQEYLEKLRTSRMEALQSQQQDEEEEDVKDAPDPEEEFITSEQFSLMQKTAQALRGAANRSILEARIYANHGNDARFAFLRKTSDNDAPSRLDRTWQALKEGKHFTLEAANSDTNTPLKTLVAYGSSEEEEDPKSEEQTSYPTSKSEDSIPIPEEDAETKRKRRLQLAHEWSRKKQEERTKKEATDTTTSTSHTHST
ncbi:uncharacterized protein FA14DRAFT_37363 [Meira miltonrushii]|uniref:Uncharacterized protein n=1 Tax=Meira miltonrushii TaxID=1280837 RepID=A0A316VC29_9BASI|nr:uncharacterized protein FA14DRAFT_37363 [Meira miltonrushii]PWN35086.1 hypothetical protein FA14DRAFT_37363 [Meira miltonrushii]